ncbi:hypothetical protein [Streptococcus sciuri]|uniref:Phospholipase n=1 Tax=Streptococcus sciuri TaxID=2973939 RepID=A0ABT2F4W0_9STRE|nr:hypothetical protein [Streptococcus sciuri]MCS4487506.1 hypothetical protein [Streptococcus sciuri]
MKKFLLKLVICLVTLFSVSSITLVSQAEENIVYDEAEVVGNKVIKYINLYNNRVYFDYDKAKLAGESEEVLEQGLLLELVSNEFSQRTVESPEVRSFAFAVWGNYCGPGYDGDKFTKPAQDILDAGCQAHDKCFKWGWSWTQNCECNKQLVDYIDAHKSEMTGNMAKTAWAIRTYFNTIGSWGCH